MIFCGSLFIKYSILRAFAFSGKPYSIHEPYRKNHLSAALQLPLTNRKVSAKPPFEAPHRVHVAGFVVFRFCTESIIVFTSSADITGRSLPVGRGYITEGIT